MLVKASFKAASSLELWLFWLPLIDSVNDGHKQDVLNLLKYQQRYISTVPSATAQPDYCVPVAMAFCAPVIILNPLKISSGVWLIR